MKTTSKKAQKDEAESETAPVPAFRYPPDVSKADRAAILQGTRGMRRRQALDVWNRYRQSPDEGGGTRPEDWTEEQEKALIRVKMERVTSTDLPSLSWGDFAELDHLCDDEGEASQDLWGQLLTYAREELNSGHRGGIALESYSSKPIDRARFIALRRGFAMQWEPRGAIEWNLIDQMAQAYTMWENWLKTAAIRVNHAYDGDQAAVFERSAWPGTPQTEAEGINAAGDEADRWHRIFVRTLRQLRDLRRYNVNITAGQVNIATNGGHQVNVTEGDAGEPVPVTIAQGAES